MTDWLEPLIKDTEILREKTAKIRKETEILKEWEENIIEPVDYSYYGLTLKNTCVLCPEQYDVYYGDTLCGYMRLRHGYFTTEYYENPRRVGLSDEIVYHSDTKGGGRFLCEEREEHLKRGAEAIIKRIDTTSKDC